MRSFMPASTIKKRRFSPFLTYRTLEISDPAWPTRERPGST